jgi:hypothetical protein
MTQAYVLKKQFVIVEDMNAWVDFLLVHDVRCYNILTFKNNSCKNKKLCIRFYFDIMEFKLEEKEITHLSYGFIPSQWRLQKEVKKSTPVTSFSKFLGKDMTDKFKKRSEFLLSKDIQCNLDYPSNTLEIKSESLLKLYHFIMDNSVLFNKFFSDNQSNGKYLVDHE